MRERVNTKCVRLGESLEILETLYAGEKVNKLI